MRTAFSLAAGLAFAAGLWSAPLQAQTLEEIQERGTVNIGMLVDFPPFGIMNEQNQPDGFDA
ncbi:MAG TPA: ABC transporter substrate-binding protein, partial [Kiloniellales bacterium]|nr:ABC transporter substrate-binding protein [Kiloniellales bacterium]